MTDGDAALRELEAEAGPSLALIDWTMPGLTGVEVCRKVRQRVGANPPHLILVTTLSERSSPSGSDRVG